MKFNLNQQDLQQALNFCQGIIEKRSTLPILSNILLDAQHSKLTITATDLDLIFIHEINNMIHHIPFWFKIKLPIYIIMYSQVTSAFLCIICS